MMKVNSSDIGIWQKLHIESTLGQLDPEARMLAPVFTPRICFQSKVKNKKLREFASSLILLKSIFRFVLYFLFVVEFEIEGQRKKFWPPALSGQVRSEKN